MRYAVLEVTGRDAEPFLQGQLTLDVAALGADAVAPAAYLTPQGRVLGIPWVARRAEGFDLLLPASTATSLGDRLSRYVLRSKVTITAAAVATPLAARVAVELSRRAGLPAAEPVAIGPDAALLIRAGIAEVGRETAEEWIPQMLNLDLVGAISFTKGCYTGQEIVARTQHLGRIKRRLFRYGGPAPPPDRVPPPADLPAGSLWLGNAGTLGPRTALLAGDEKVGEIVLAARTRTAAECLAVVNLEARGRPLRTADGSLWEPLPLPYALD
ncbi:MAG: folate-binding protein YgfZ [Proteobacteria bacterium]|nr:folate-binding protein YgfZ [Pseudomonadota bacterium]